MTIEGDSDETNTFPGLWHCPVCERRPSRHTAGYYANIYGSRYDFVSKVDGVVCCANRFQRNFEGASSVGHAFMEIYIRM